MDKEFLQIEPWGKNGLRVRATQNRGFIEDELGALLPGSEGGQPYANVSVTTNRVAGTAEIVNGKIRCTISCKGKLRFYNEKNELLLEECYRDRYGRKIRQIRTVHWNFFLVHFFRTGERITTT